MPNYLNSNNINIFPISTDRTNGDRQLSEKNIADFGWNLVDVEAVSVEAVNEEGDSEVKYYKNAGYVVSYDSKTNKIVFVIQGYLISADLSSFNFNNTLYSYIVLPNAGSINVRGSDVDVEGKYTGVRFVTDVGDITVGDGESDCSVYVLQLFDSDRKVPVSSQYKFTSKSIKDIDGGEV